VVLLSICILVGAGLALALIEGAVRPDGPVTASRLYEVGGVLLLGMAVGFTELVSHYRDEPWRTSVTTPGLVFIAFNGAAAMAALALLHHFPAVLHRPDDRVVTSLAAGTGAMVVLRSKLFSVRQADGTDVAFGPAFIVDTMLAAVNRDVDRNRARRRSTLVSRCASALRNHDYTEAYPYLMTSLHAFQNMEADAAKRLLDALKALADDPQLKRNTDRLRFMMAGYSVLTEYGERTFEAVFAALVTYLEETGLEETGAGPRTQAEAES
jgi:hypothetical protein